jgi:hypothetical protein
MRWFRYRVKMTYSINQVVFVLIWVQDCRPGMSERKWHWERHSQGVQSLGLWQHWTVSEIKTPLATENWTDVEELKWCDMLWEYRTIETLSEGIQFLPGCGLAEIKYAKLNQSARVQAEIVQEFGEHIINHNVTEKYAFTSQNFIDVSQGS